MVYKTLVNNLDKQINYQPQLVSGSRISEPPNRIVSPGYLETLSDSAKSAGDRPDLGSEARSNSAGDFGGVKNPWAKQM